MKSKTTGLVSLLAALIAVAGCSIVSKSTSSPGRWQGSIVSESTLSAERLQLNVESFEAAWEVVNRTYWDPEFGGLDWEGVRDELRPQIEEARTMSEARQVIRDMISRPGVSHFGLIPAEVYEDLDPEKGKFAGATGIEVRVIEGSALVFTVDEGSSSDRLGVRPGWEILEVEGRDARERLREIAGEIGDGPRKPSMLSSAIGGRLHGPIGETVDVAFLDGEGERVQLELPLEEERGETIQLGHLPPFRVWIESKWLEENIGYISFNAFLHPNHVMKGYNDAMASFAEADGIVIDIRGNPGGMHGMLAGMVGWLIQERKDAGTIYMRDNELRFIFEPRATNYDGAVVVIVDEHCASAAEVFAGSLKELERARIIGAQTMGAVLGARLEKLPNGDGLMYAAVNFETSSGETLEGVGVRPHEEVHPTRQALLDGRDPALDAAIAWIHQQ